MSRKISGKSQISWKNLTAFISLDFSHGRTARTSRTSSRTSRENFQENSNKGSFPRPSPLVRMGQLLSFYNWHERHNLQRKPKATPQPQIKLERARHFNLGCKQGTNEQQEPPQDYRKRLFSHRRDSYRVELDRSMRDFRCHGALRGSPAGDLWLRVRNTVGNPAACHSPHLDRKGHNCTSAVRYRKNGNFFHLCTPADRRYQISLPSSNLLPPLT